MANSHTKKTESKKSDIITNKILIVFSLTFVLVIALMFLYRTYNTLGSDVVMLQNILFITGGSLVGVGVLAGILTLVRSREMRDEEKSGPRTSRFVYLCAIALLVGACSLYVGWLGMPAIKSLYVLLPALAVLYLVFYIYQREFFWITAAMGLGAAMLWSYNYLHTTVHPFRALMVACAGILGCALAVLLVYLIRKKEGLWPFGRSAPRILPKTAGYGPIFAALAVIALCLVLAMIFGAQFAYYAMFVLLGILFVGAIYYTVRLM